MLDVLENAALIKLHDQALKSWYADPPNMLDTGSSLKSLILAQHFCNYNLWNLEDQARLRKVSDSRIAEVKRSIDTWNQRRNDLIEQIDQFLLEMFSSVDISEAEQHSETAGMMIDRISILALKIRNMTLISEDRLDAVIAAEGSKKLEILKTQRQDLMICLQKLINDFQSGRRYFKSYRQFKTYNDPRLNPLLRVEEPVHTSN